MVQAAEKSFRASDFFFILIFTAALGLVVVIGRLAYHEATLTEGAKANAEKLKLWFDELAAAHAQGKPTPLEDCSTTAEKSWSQCRDALLGENGPLKGLSNPFDPKLAVIGPKCDREDYLNTRGLVVLEKGTPAPPGAPPGVSFSTFEDADPLTREMPARILVCDKGAYALRVAEVKL